MTSAMGKRKQLATMNFTLRGAGKGEDMVSSSRGWAIWGIFVLGKSILQYQELTEPVTYGYRLGSLPTACRKEIVPLLPLAVRKPKLVVFLPAYRPLPFRGRDFS